MSSQADAGSDLHPAPPPSPALRSRVALLLRRCGRLRTRSYIRITPLRKLIEHLVGGCLYRLCQIILNVENMATQIISHNQAGRMKFSEVFCQHFLRSRWDQASELTKAGGPLPHDAKNLYPPLPLEEIDG